MGDDSNTSLLKAALSNNIGLVNELLEQGADINGTDKTGKTALMSAAGKGNYEIVKLLLEKGADVSIVEDEIGGGGGAGCNQDDKQYCYKETSIQSH